VGTSNQYTLFTGTLQDAGKGGSLTKVGTGQFVLKGANLYNGGTLVSDGQLLVANTTGSGTGSGQVKVTRRGILGGTGVIAGSVTVGTGRGTGGKLTPGIASTTFSTLTIQGLLTFKGGGIYAPRVYGRSGTADQVQANGVTIENGARISLPGANQGTVPPDTVYTVISNTANTSISGTFSNLADGGTLTVGNNTFQANYEGGDGNDLVLTVVP
jgi:autotransporter-associated beta strand protein